jgi:hypothetical protein
MVKTPLSGVPELYKFSSLVDADQTLSFEMRGWAKSLSPDEDAALSDYKDVLGRQINLALRDPTETDRLLTQRAALLEGALAKAKFPFAVQTWRAAGPEELDMFARAKAGRIIRSRTFISASLDRDIAESIAAAENRSVIQIIVASGTIGVAYVHPFPDYQHEEFEIC